MSEKIVVGPVNRGLRTDRLPFNIDNDSFPTLINAYQWRGRVKRKRGTSLLGRLIRFFNSSSTSYSSTATISLVGGAANILTGFSLQTNGNIVPGTVVIHDTTASAYYTDVTPATGHLYTADQITAATQANPCVLTVNNSFSVGDKVYISYVNGMTQLNGNTYTITVQSPTSISINVDSTGFSAYTSGGFAADLSQPNGTINYATGAITITGGGTDSISAEFLYYPDLPVMDIEDLVLTNDMPIGTLAFDTTYAYNIVTASPFNIYDVSFYKNPASTTINGIAYTAKTTPTPVTWNGQNYQQFWSTSYEGALWVTNGVQVPFNTSNIGMQFKIIASITYVSSTNLTITITESSASLVVGDWVFINEVTGTNSSTVNFQTGFVTSVSNNGATTTLTVRFPYANISNQAYSNGILQYLTNRSNSTIDCIRWYDGDPTNGNATNPILNGHKGWVNFMPPISQASLTFGTPDDIPAGQYYLVGAKMIVPYKDRLLFIGPVVQTSSGSPLYLQDTVIYSENGTPYYTASFSGSVSSPTTTFNPLLTPINQASVPGAYFSDQTGFGGYITAGHSRPIITAGFNEDVLILGFSNRQTRFLYTGNDLVPFNFFTVNSEFGSTSTFSIITLDRAVLTTGNNGIIATAQIGAERIDLEILDQIFQFNLENNGTERVTAQRDFINEWVYFTYCSNEQSWIFPNQTLLYNYRDKSWAIFNEAYTCYGQFRISSGLTWGTVGNIFPTWGEWNQPWGSGSSTTSQPLVVAGNQQGFIFFRENDTAEAQSLYIQSISGNTITSPDHTLNNGDFITITINGTSYGIFQVDNPTENTFIALGGMLPTPYFGLGTIQRMYVPYIQTKQFPVSWGDGRKTRIGSQMYLLSNTNVSNSQITLLLFLSEGATGQFGVGPAYNNLEYPLPVEVVPSPNSQNDALVYSTVLYTCPESTNIGLTPANTNLQMLTASTQNQIWHRMNTSLIGDTVQVGFTMNSAQMLDPTFASQFSEIELHSMVINVSPSMVLA